MASQEMESLWDDKFIKEMMEKIASEERPMASFSYPSGTSTSSSYAEYGRSYSYSGKERKAAEKEIEIMTKEEKVKEDLRTKPQLFDPKELDLDDKK